MSEKAKDVLIRALKTFWQAALAYIMVDINQLITSIANSSPDVAKQVVKTVIVGAAAAGFSAVWNSVLAPIFDKGDTQLPVVEGNSVDTNTDC